jgi:two-component system sensor histidine kinase KdpD
MAGKGAVGDDAGNDRSALGTRVSSRREYTAINAHVIFRTYLISKPYISSFLAVLGALAVALSIDRLLDAHSPSRVFLVAVLISAIAHGLWPAVFASLISAIAYDYFFLPPVYSLSIVTNEGIIDFCLFVLVALIVSALAARVRRYALAADARALTAETLSAFTQYLADASTAQETLDHAAERISERLGMPVALVLTEGDVPVVNAACPRHIVPDADCLRRAVAWWSLRPEQDGSQGFIVGDWRFQTLRGTGETFGLMAIKLGRVGVSARAGQDRLLAALAYQTGLALDRCALRDHVEQSRLHAETERLRSTVLTSISHDLRNPLASMTTSASVLEHQWHSLDDASKRLMARTIRDEAQRLDDFVGKLLDVTRIDANMIRIHNERIFVLDVVEAAIQLASSALAGHRVAIDVPDDLPPVVADGVLLQQVLYNLIENATKYTPRGSLIRIVARTDGQSLSVSVSDEGPGIPDADRERIFDRFYRVQSAQGQTAGSGLGLAICRGFLEVMHGTIDVTNRDDRSGAAFKITLPSATNELREVEL